MARINGYPDSVQAGAPKLGTLPVGWERKPLSASLRLVQRPVKFDDNQLYSLVTVKRSRGGVVLREQLRGKQIKVKSQFYVSAGDFLISKRQIVHGACGIVPPELDGAIVSNEYAVFRSTADLLLPFLQCLSESLYFQQTCFHSSIGVHIEKMLFKVDRWLGYMFDIPPLHEQRRIVEMVSTWQHAIRTATKLAANSKAQTAALVQRILGVIEQDPRSKLVRLSDIAECYSGGTPSRTKRHYFQGAIPWIKSGEVNSRLVVRTEESISGEALEESSAKMVYPGTILIAMYGATAGKVALSAIEAAINQAILAVRPNTDINADFLFFVLEYEMHRATRFVQGGQPNLNAGIIKDTRLIIPARSEQDHFASILKCSNEQARQVLRMANLVERERKALLQQLLTGKRRVKNNGVIQPVSAVG